MSLNITKQQSTKLVVWIKTNLNNDHTTNWVHIDVLFSRAVVSCKGPRHLKAREPDCMADLPLRLKGLFKEDFALTTI